MGRGREKLPPQDEGKGQERREGERKVRAELRQDAKHEGREAIE